MSAIRSVRKIVCCRLSSSDRNPTSPDGGGLEFYVDADVDFDFHVDVDEFCSSQSLAAI